MNRYFKTIIVTLSTLILVVFFGCSMMADVFTPCPIQPAAGEYANEPLLDFMPFTTLYDAKRIDAKLDYQHDLNQITFARLSEDDNSKYGFVKDVHITNMQSGLEFQQVVYSPTGPIGALIPTLTAGTLGALLISKPADKRRIKELETNGNGKPATV